MHQTVPSASRFRTALRSVIFWLALAALGVAPACNVTANGMFSDVQRFRVGTGGNGIGSHELHQYYFCFGLFRLNKINVQEFAADLTSYDITTGRSFVDWMWSIICLPVLVSRSTVKVDY